MGKACRSPVSKLMPARLRNCTLPGTIYCEIEESILNPTLAGGRHTPPPPPPQPDVCDVYVILHPLVQRYLISQAYTYTYLFNIQNASAVVIYAFSSVSHICFETRIRWRKKQSAATHSAIPVFVTV